MFLCMCEGLLVCFDVLLCPLDFNNCLFIYAGGEGEITFAVEKH